MATLRWSLLIYFILAVPLYAENPPSPMRSRAEIRLDLLGPITLPSPDSSAAAVPATVELSGRKSVGLAAIYSLILPGMGELYAGGFGSGKFFLIAEGALWMTYAGFQITGDAMRADARSFAAVHAGAQAAGKDDQFFVDVGNFASTADYNEKRLRDRDVERLYDPALGYAWQWDSETSRIAFRDQRIRSETLYNDRKFVVGVIIINHIASAINAARSAISHNAGLGSPLGDLRVDASLMGSMASPHGIMLTLTKGF